MNHIYSALHSAVFQPKMQQAIAFQVCYFLNGYLPSKIYTHSVSWSCIEESLFPFIMVYEWSIQFNNSIQCITKKNQRKCYLPLDGLIWDALQRSYYKFFVLKYFIDAYNNIKIDT